MNVLESIHKQAFEHPIQDIEFDLQGWCGPPFLETFTGALDIIAKKQDLLILEVGSWKGLSTCTMANHLKQSNVSGRIIAIDTWLGSPEHLTWCANHLGKRDLGFPQLYKQFLMNVQHEKLVDYIYPLPIASAQGAYFLKASGIQADIIYIDAGHEYEAVKLDIELYWRLLANGGVMIFDDYTSGWPGVKRAIDEFAQTQKLQVTCIGQTAKIVKLAPVKLL